jgi:hypothetical protein
MNRARRERVRSLGSTSRERDARLFSTTKYATVAALAALFPLRAQLQIPLLSILLVLI